MKIDLLSPDDVRWAEWLETRRHDFYHLPAYVEIAAVDDGGRACALLVSDGGRSMLLPLVVREVPGGGGRLDAISPYGYPGPLVDVGAEDAGAREAFASEALDAAAGVLAGEGWVSVFVRLHPVLGPVPRPACGALVQHGDTIAVDLRLPEDELWRQTMSGHRNEINRAMRAGHRVFRDEAWEHLGRFIDIYHATMRRVGASEFYFFGEPYVNRLRGALGERLSLFVVEIEERVAAAGLFVEAGNLVQYHLSGTDEVFAKHRPTKLMLHHVRAWAKARGDDFLHLGGGVGGAADSLFKFKSGFSPLRFPFHTLRCIVDPSAYAALVRARGLDPATQAAGGFFPAYRRP